METPCDCSYKKSDTWEDNSSIHTTTRFHAHSVRNSIYYNNIQRNAKTATEIFGEDISSEHIRNPASIHPQPLVKMLTNV